VVRIDPPPPKRTTDPVLYLLPAAATLQRIYRPDQYGSTACGFRTDGPFSRFDHHEPGQQRGIHYSAFSLSGCVVEVFGDTGVVETQGCRLALIRTTRPLQLLDLRGSGAMRAGSVAALSAIADRDLSQAWSRHFYSSHAVDGLLYSNAHNSESAIALYDRAEAAISCSRDLALDDPLLRSRLLQICRDHALVMA
jgi:hypothetical protein